MANLKIFNAINIVNIPWPNMGHTILYDGFRSKFNTIYIVTAST